MVNYYCAPSDVRDNVAGTDSGTGTCAQLSDSELTAAIVRASSRVSAWTGQAYDPPDVPDLIFDLTVQLATWYGTLTYRKGKALPADDPVALGYADAMATLKAISSGSVVVVPPDPGDPPGPDEPQPSVPRVINTIPSVFSGRDSATEVTSGGRLRAAGAWGTGRGW